jgi:phage gpG-like protein
MAGWKLKTQVKYHLRTDEIRARVKAAKMEPVKQCALLVQRTAQELLSKGGGSNHTPSNVGDPPNLQTGALRTSITVAQKDETHYVVGPTIKYGSVQEFGRPNIQPVTKQWLTIPFHPMAYGKRANEFELTFIQVREELALLVLKNAEKHKGKIIKKDELMFILVKSVSIPARPFMRPAFNKVIPQFPKLFHKMLKR